MAKIEKENLYSDENEKIKMERYCKATMLR